VAADAATNSTTVGTFPRSTVKGQLHSVWGGRGGKRKIILRKSEREEGGSVASSRYANDGAWTPEALERKIASIVQLYDPVTVAIVVKKLAQFGYRSDDAHDIVERVLRRFHDRQLIFYDNGIAYLM